jgi:DNA-binding FadR family transcriptional regulator
MENSLDFPLMRSRLFEQVADKIQSLIVDESLHPGDKLPSERDLAESLGVSRTVIREAVRVLSVRGLLTVKAGSGTYIQTKIFKPLKRPLRRYPNVLKMQSSLPVATWNFTLCWRSVPRTNSITSL